MKMKYAIILVILAIFFSGCISQESQRGGIQLPSPIKQAGLVENNNIFVINETIAANNVSFLVSEWGYAPAWGFDNPPAGAKYLWVHVVSENVGSIPQTLPTIFTVSYRGTNVSAMSGPHGLEEDAIYAHGDTLFYPGVKLDGNLLFKVPVGLGDDEATFFVDMGNVETYKIMLNDPTPYNGEHISIVNVTLNCTPDTNDAVRCDALSVTLRNDEPVPIIIPQLMMNNPTLAGKSWVMETVGETLKMSPRGEFVFETNPMMSIKKGESGYSILKYNSKDYETIGNPGDEVTIGFDIEYIDKDGNKKVETQTTQLKLPYVQPNEQQTR